MQKQSFFILGVLILFIGSVSVLLLVEKPETASGTFAGKAVGNPPVNPPSSPPPPPGQGTIYVYGSKLVATKNYKLPTNNQLTYHFQDSLGSNRYTINSWGQIQSKATEYPYGKTLDETSFSNAKEKYLFTGKEKDNVQLYYYGARYYNPRIGRFASVDPISSTFAGYDYAANNPLKFIDPSGNEASAPKLNFWQKGFAYALEHAPTKLLDILSGGRGETGKNFMHYLRGSGTSKEISLPDSFWKEWISRIDSGKQMTIPVFDLLPGESEPWGEKVKREEKWIPSRSAFYPNKEGWEQYSVPISTWLLPDGGSNQEGMDPTEGKYKNVWNIYGVTTIFRQTADGRTSYAITEQFDFAGGDQNYAHENFGRFVPLFVGKTARFVFSDLVSFKAQDGFERDENDFNKITIIKAKTGLLEINGGRLRQMGKPFRIQSTYTTSSK